MKSEVGLVARVPRRGVRSSRKLAREEVGDPEARDEVDDPEARRGRLARRRALVRRLLGLLHGGGAP